MTSADRRNPWWLLLTILLAAIAAVGTYSVVAATRPATVVSDAPSLAATAVHVAETAWNGGNLADVGSQVGRTVPAGDTVVVGLPTDIIGVTGGSPAFVANVVTLVGIRTDRAKTVDTLSRSAQVGSATTANGWWAAVSVPAAAAPSDPSALLAALVVAGFVIVAMVIGGLRRRPRGDLVGPPVSVAPQPMNLVAVEQRAALVAGLINLLPQLPDAVNWQAIDCLNAAGVHPLNPDGDPFDPARHEAMGVEPTGRADLVDTVARTVRSGYVDGDRIVVPPKVIVYQRESERR